MNAATQDMVDCRPALEAGLGALGLALSPQQVDDLLRYQGLLAKWNHVYNLTAVRSPQEMVTHHLLDSLSVVPGRSPPSAPSPGAVATSWWVSPGGRSLRCP